MTWLIIVFGFLFGALLQYARLNRFDTISGMATLEDFAVAKAIFFAIGVGAFLINVEISLGMASYHLKPLTAGGIVIGGLIFGAGMAILGYCPGTMAVSLGEGAVDALLGIIGGLLGGLVYTLVLPRIGTFLGPDLGSISLETVSGNHTFLFYLLLLVIGALFMAAAFRIHRLEKAKDLRWAYAGAGLAVLNAFVFLTAASNRPIGASTTYPYLADILTGLTNNDYFAKIQKPGNWELWFLAGAFLSGLVLSLARKDFKIRLIYNNWKKYKGDLPAKRITWALIGGFILIFGARMAGGCTSGHILSGGMQLAASSLIFAVFVFAGLLLTGKLFYRKKE